MYEFLREKTTSFSALLGIDTTSVFLHGIRLAPRTRIVKGGNGLWHAVKSLRGVSVIMQMSHGAGRKQWKPANRRTAKAVVRETAKELTKYVVGGVAVAFIEHRLKNAFVTQIDTTEDVGASMNLLSVVAPKEKYGVMRVKRFHGTHGTGVTHYWGRRAGYMKDPGGEFVLDENEKKVYQRASAKQIRVYDKRKQMLDEKGIDIGEECTRIEITLTGTRTIRQNLGFSTLQEYFDCTDEELRIRALFDELTVTANGQIIDPLTPSQRREAEGKPRLAKKLRRNERRREKMQSLGNTGKNECQDTHCFYEGGPGAWEFRRGDWVFVPEDPCPCPGAGGTPGRVVDEAGVG